MAVSAVASSSFVASDVTVRPKVQAESAPAPLRSLGDRLVRGATAAMPGTMILGLTAGIFSGTLHSVRTRQNPCCALICQSSPCSD